MTNETAVKMLKFRWLIFAILALAYFFVYFHRLSLSVVANDIVKDFNTTASVMGLLGSIWQTINSLNSLISIRQAHLPLLESGFMQLQPH